MKFKIGLILTTCLFFLGCATPKVVDLNSSNAREAVEEIQKLKTGLIESNADLLAKDFYEKGNDDLNDALEDLKDDKPKKEIMNRLAQAKAHFIDAKKVAKSRKALPSEVLTARSNAIKFNAHQSLKAELYSVDEDLRDETDIFTQDLSVVELSRFQNKYLKLEVKAVQNQKLSIFRAIITKAEKNDASKLAPKTFNAARSDLKNAENLIKQSPRDSSQYSDSVEKANKSAKLLNDVMEKLQGEAKGASETVALKLVYQERKLGKLSDKVQNLQGSLGASQFALGSASQTIIDKDAEILSVESKNRFQTAMDRVRKSFGEEEASVYQQGDQLIIRLKKIDFKSGKATVPTDAVVLLSKISNIVSELDPQEIIIQGHTDSVGEESYNMMLSNKRASAVKTYFLSLNVDYPINARGFGESKPIANNQTKNGRALNRRVDIVVKAKQ